MKTIRIGIIGGAGYTGGELIRVLVQHPVSEIVFVHSRSNAGKAVTSVHRDLIGETDLYFTDTHTQEIDLLFLCLGHGASRAFLEHNTIKEHIKVIDLANDFRIQDQALWKGHAFIYGLPELQKEKIKTAQYLANPGCFATAIQLGLLPLAAAGVLGAVYTTGITGSTGAGQSLSSTSHFSWRANNIQAYKTLSHQHLTEIGQSLKQLQADIPADAVHFIPWRGDFPRGIFVSTQLKNDLSLDALYTLYEHYYREHPFVHLSKDPIDLKQVVNTNKCLIQIEKQGEDTVIHSTIDNLLKGAVGQAVQNMNLMFGLEEMTGLHLKSLVF
ncbi:N-acetyl-gamma-glutamyl-phosphate reductase [Taibaiella sp. KBW10]|uniref:N-acetyl-gamma-glutamyl-phosphate reductase n=1 Tax=Taibaiella sp. KBW10 TaxID=2153357 RepID=UPI000F5959CD|nr:N-acetyl-gamma-glutamyl-phosphate reductase [Taibaiella sp. KBW10]RQO30876.1 N-acetyl-gamma-glutamyl-phosphate reductase [Taibaiella sp. KBW10]